MKTLQTKIRGLLSLCLCYKAQRTAALVCSADDVYTDDVYTKFVTFEAGMVMIGAMLQERQMQLMAQAMRLQQLSGLSPVLLKALSAMRQEPVASWSDDDGTDDGFDQSNYDQVLLLIHSQERCSLTATRNRTLRMMIRMEISTMIPYVHASIEDCAPSCFSPLACFVTGIGMVTICGRCYSTDGCNGQLIGSVSFPVADWSHVSARHSAILFQPVLIA